MSSRYGNSWINPSPASRYGGSFLSDRVGPGAASTGLEGVATAPAGISTKRTSPDHPLFWVGVLLLITFGVGGVSTTVRLGKERATVELGST
jgi:hypothetical protein